MDPQRIWDLYCFGCCDQRDFRLMFPGVPVEEMRRVIVAAAAAVKYRIPPNHLLTCERCGAPTCGAQGMKMRDGRFTCVECVTLEWLQF
jgi:hypothetical protein